MPPCGQARAAMPISPSAGVYSWILTGSALIKATCPREPTTMPMIPGGDASASASYRDSAAVIPSSSRPTWTSTMTWGASTTV